MRTIENQTFDAERALYGSRDLCVRNCRFDGPADGESAFKEAGILPQKTAFLTCAIPSGMTMACVFRILK